MHISTSMFLVKFSEVLGKKSEVWVIFFCARLNVFDKNVQSSITTTLVFG